MNPEERMAIEGLISTLRDAKTDTLGGFAEVGMAGGEVESQLDAAYCEWTQATRSFIRSLEEAIEAADRHALGLPTAAEISESIVAQFVEVTKAQAESLRRG